MCLFGMIVAFAGSVALAGGPYCGSAKGRKHMRQLDEVDKLLMQLGMQEKMQNCAKKKYGHRKMQKKGTCPLMKGKSCDRSKMMKNNEKSCDGAKKCYKTRTGTCGKKYGNKKFTAKSHQWKRKFRGNVIMKSYLMEKYPEEMDKIIKLKKSNDKIENDILMKFKKLVDEAKAKMKADREKMKAEHQQFVKMVDEYKKTKDAKLAEQIKAKMSQFYDKRLEYMKKKIDKDADRVQKAYAGLKEKKANKDKEIAERFEKITK